MANKNEIEAAIALAEVQTGVRGGKRAIPLCHDPVATRNRIWTEQENQFLRDNHGRISEVEIAHRLGRTPIAVHIHKERELKLESMSKAPDILTAEQVANGLGCDSKSIHLLLDTGRMPGRRLPSARPIRVVNRLVLMKWILDPDHWLYFKPGRVGTLHRRGKRVPGESYDFAFWENARRLITKARRKWKDAWLTPGQVTQILKIKPKPTRRRTIKDRIPGVRYVNRAIRKGTLKAKRWGNWWIRKSDLPPRGKTINFRGEIVNFRF